MSQSPQAESGKGLIRAISRWGLAALIVNCTIGSGVFALPSALAEKAGRASITGVVLAGAAVGVIMLCFAEVASRFQDSGGPYLYAREAFGNFMGIQVAWLVWFVRLTSCAANADVFATYLGEFWPRANQWAPRLVVLTALIGMLAAINFIGVRAGTRVSTTFTAAKLASLAFVIVVGMVYLIWNGRIIPPASAAPSARSWMQAIVLLIFAYGGFEAALISSGEVRNPRRDLPFGLLAGLFTCAAVYGLIQWVVVGTLADAAHSARPLADVARIAVGNASAAIIAASALCSIYGYLSANILATPRITFALAERGDFPKAFGLVHPRYRTPYFSIVLFSSLVWVFAVIGDFTWNVTLSAGSRLFYYGVVCAALPMLRKKGGTPGFRVPGGSGLAVVGVLICGGLLTQIDYSKSAILLGAFGMALAHWLLVRKRR